MLGSRLTCSTICSILLLMLAIALRPSQARVPGLRLLQDSNPPDPTKPCVGSSTGSFMTAISKCPNDEFYISSVKFGTTMVGAMGADGTPVKGAVKHMWVGGNLGGDPKAWQHPNTYIAVLRASDGKLVVPKGVDADGVTPVDISGTKRRVCQLFAQNSKPLRFASFRARLTADGSKVVRNDFGAKPNEYPEGLDCEKYSEVLINPATTAVGKMTDVYKPPSCLFIIDDCSK